METKLLTCALTLISFFVFIITHSSASGQFVFDVDQFRNSALPAFDKKFLTFAADALQNVSIAGLFSYSGHRGSGRRRVGTQRASGENQRDGGNPFSPKQVLIELMTKVDRRYSDAVRALTNLKEEFERNIKNPSQSPRPRDLYRCCISGVPSPVVLTYSYEGRYRDTVNVSQECVGKTAESASTPFLLRADDAFELMKGNYENDTSILWQYVATLDGHYVQFPAKNRYCDGQGHTTSPLTQRWLVDKLLQPKLNLVILLDAGQRMNSAVPQSVPPIRHLAMAKHAVKRIVRELAFVDRVTVVVMNGSAVTPPGCGDRLMIATDRNADVITDFVESVQAAADPSHGLAEGFQKAYSLLRAEKAVHKDKDTNDVIMLLTNGEFVVLDEDDILGNVTTGQNDLGNTVTHLVYLIQSGTFTVAMETLVKLADLNNLRIDNATAWAGVSASAVGPVGQIRVLPESVGFQYSDIVAEFYQFFPRGTVDGMDRITAVSPRRDPKVGLILTYAMPIYNDTLKHLSSLYGAAAIDVSMASLFDDVLYFKWRFNSYGFVVERERGLVLVHPKLDSPAEQTEVDPVFSSLEFVEPTLTAEQRDRVLAANSSVLSFEAEIVPGRTTYKTGLDLSNAQTSPATVLFCRLPDTEYIFGMVMFRREMKQDPSTAPDVENTLGFKGEALYHHELLVNETAHGACAYSSDVRVNDKVTVKFSPEVFTDPELYMHTKESQEQINNMTKFLNQDALPPLTVRPEVLTTLVVDLKIISSQSLSNLWHYTSVGGVVERVIGTPNGVFAAFPGISLPNAFDGKEYGWYRESLARPRSVWVSLRRSFTTPDRRVTLSTTLHGYQSIYGVTGVTVSRRSFAGLFYNTVRQCLGTNYTCHLLTDSGYLLDMLDMMIPPGSQRHLTAVYPWLAIELVRRQVMKPVWCTTLSKGRHRLTYILHVQPNGVSHDAHVNDTCRQFLLSPVEGSNLVVLVLTNRRREGCQDNAPCMSCQSQPGGTQCTRCLPLSITPTPPMFPPRPHCQCPCHCSVDFNVCQDSFRHMANGTFPLTPCYEEPEMPSLTMPPGGGDRPSGALPPCHQLCPTFEKREDCEAISHCMWKDDELYPVCVAHTPTTTTTTSTAATTTTTKSKMSVLPSKSGSTSHQTTTTRTTMSEMSSRPSGSTSHQRQTTGSNTAGQHGTDDSGSKLGGGAIAGIVVGIAAVLAVGFLIGYYKLVKPRLFSRLRETDESVTGVQGVCNSAHYNSQSDSLDLSGPPMTPSDISIAPTHTAIGTSHT